MNGVVGHAGVHANQAGGDQADQPRHDKENPSECCSFLNHNGVASLFAFSLREWTLSILPKKADSS
jgi:hypothetical protein